MNTPIHLPHRTSTATFAEAVRDGLSREQKSLPARFFYDLKGSELFEAITELPEYYLTRCEQSILDRYAGTIAAELEPETVLIEFGSGSSKKTRTLIEAILSQRSHLHYFPIDISSEFLQETAKTLQESYAGLSITPIVGEYFDATVALPAADRPRMVLFLGSNIGNFDREESLKFLEEIATGLNRRDKVLIGTDLQKDPRVIAAAYNDSSGVTERFNKNVLLRINKELGGTFDPSLFAHHAPYMPEHGKVEMRLVSREAHAVGISALDAEFTFAEGEFIHTEDSHKFTPEGFEALAAKAGLCVMQTYTDERSWFALNLLQPSKQ